MTGTQPITGDRASILAELEELAARDDLAGTEQDRLFFHFRASDPGVYQPAARILGRQAVGCPGLRARLASFAKQRGAPLGEPMQLNGQRSRRRILIARCALWIAEAPSERGAAPIATRYLQDGLPEHPGDAAALLACTAELLTTGAVADLAWAAAGLLEQLPAAETDRMVWTRWAELLFAIRTHGSPTQVPGATGMWREALARLLPDNGTTTTVVDTTRRLIALDALLCVAGRHPDALQELSSAWPGVMADRDRRWCRLRLATWSRRHFPDRTPMLTVEPRDYTSLAYYAARVEQAWQAPGGRIGPSAVELAGQELLDMLARRVETREAWLRLPRTERAIALLLTTDLTEAVALAPEQVRAQTGERIQDRRLDVVWAIRVADWEGFAPEAVLDARSLHALTSDAICEQLIRPGRGLSRESAVPDVLENRFRLAAAGDPAFDERRYLLRLAARAEAPELFRRMALISRDRAYTSATGDELPFHDWVAALGRETHDGSPGLDTTFGHREALRTALAELDHRPGSPGEDLGRLVAAIGQPGATVGSPPGTLVGLARQLGLPGDTWSDGERVLDKTLQEVLALEPWLAPDAWRNPPMVREAVASLDHQLHALSRCLRHWVPATDFQLLARVLDGLRQRGHQWLSGVEAVAACAARDRDGEDAWQAALEQLPDDLSERPRTGLTTELLDVLRLHTREPARLLAWSLTRPGTATDPARVAASESVWRRAMDEALTTGDVDTARQLLTSHAFMPLRERIDDVELGNRIRRWWFDRFRPVLGIRAQRALAGTGTPAGGLFAFLGHYAAVWIGLLVGAILMLDFGDAWRAMAEDGDTRGIAITFLIGAGGTTAYLLAHLRRKVARNPAMSAIRFWGALFVRVAFFLVLCLVYTLLATGGLWLLLSGTDEVVHGPMAIGHIVVWAGFALFAGTFFGLVAKEV